MKEHNFQQSRWQRGELLAQHKGPEFEQFLQQLEEQVAQMEARRDSLSPDITEAEFLTLMERFEAIEANGRRVAYFAHLWFAEDTQSQEALGFLGRVEQLSTEIENRLLFFSLWWKGLDDEAAQRLLAVSGDRKYFLERLRAFKPYTLSEAEEKVVNLKNVNGVNALTKLYDMITNRFVFKLEVEGEVKELTRGELTTYVRSPSPEIRAAAYQELHRLYSEQGAVLSQIYAHCVRDWSSENVALRGFATPISVRNLGNDIPDAVTETLLDVCRRNMPIFHRYFRLKARWLGLEKLRRYDVYAPLRAADKTFPFSAGADLVLDTLEQFSPVLADHARRVFVDGHLDSEIRPGKRSGAFCASPLPGMAPWVLTNYVGEVDDVMTLAHEIGHAIHAMMASDHSVLTFHSSLPLAETASVFAEMLLVDRWLQEESDPGVRRDLLVTVLDEAYATIARQAYFVIFELAAHQLALQGATIDEMNEAYLENLREQFGDSIELSDDFRWEWIEIPHLYHTPFYCYAYSFGNLLVLALYRQYKKEGQAFVPRHLKILSYGGSASPEHVISEAGFDMTSPDFWQGGFEVLREMLDELEAL